MSAIVRNIKSEQTWEFDNVFTAEAFIDTMMDVDPAGVLAGDYQIDDEAYVENYYEPTELDEWMDFDPDC